MESHFLIHYPRRDHVRHPLLTNDYVKNLVVRDWAEVGFDIDHCFSCQCGELDYDTEESCATCTVYLGSYKNELDDVTHYWVKPGHLIQKYNLIIDTIRSARYTTIDASSKIEGYDFRFIDSDDTSLFASFEPRQEDKVILSQEEEGDTEELILSSSDEEEDFDKTPVLGVKRSKSDDPWYFNTCKKKKFF